MIKINISTKQQLSAGMEIITIHHEPLLQANEYTSFKNGVMEIPNALF